MAMKSITFNILIEGGGETDGTYTAWCPSLPGCYSVGRTSEEARTRMAEAMGRHIATLLEYEDVPTRLPSATETVKVEEVEFTITAPATHDTCYH